MENDSRNPQKTSGEINHLFSESVFSASAWHVTRSFGTWRILVTDRDNVGDEHVVLTMGDVFDKANVLCRIASACLPSTALNSAECECFQQLNESFRMINQLEQGVLIYLNQEGRGHGLTTKVRALANKNLGFDTYSAVEALGLSADVRTYEAAALILQGLRVESVNLLTNNPVKVESLQRAGVSVTSVIPLAVEAPAQAQRHLMAKQERYRLAKQERYRHKAQSDR